jgi:acyl dehydratase
VDVALFALITGDQHPLHLDQHYAAATRFGRRVVPAALISGIVEAALVATIPGFIDGRSAEDTEIEDTETGLVRHQTLEYPAPAFVDDEIMVTITVLATDPASATIRCGIAATTQEGTLVARGETCLTIEHLPAVTEDETLP